MIEYIEPSASEAKANYNLPCITVDNEGAVAIWFTEMDLMWLNQDKNRGVLTSPQPLAEKIARGLERPLPGAKFIFTQE
jgi:hypothetical protein